MLNIKSMAILLKITAKLDIKPVIDKLKNLDIFAEAKSPDEAMKQLTKRKGSYSRCRNVRRNTASARQCIRFSR